MSDGVEEIRFGNRSVRFWWSSGVVLTNKTWATTSVSSSTSSDGDVTVRSYNTKWDEVWMRGPDGREWSHTFGGLGLPFHEGHTLDLLSAQPAGSKSSALLLVANRSTDRWITYDDNVRDLLHRPWLGLARVVLTGIGLLALDSYVPQSRGMIPHQWWLYLALIAHAIYRRYYPRGIKEIRAYVASQNAARTGVGQAQMAAVS